MCGVFGVLHIFSFNPPPASEECVGASSMRNGVKAQAFAHILQGLTILQHRGQDSAGIHTYDGTAVHKHIGLGKVEKVFEKCPQLAGNMGIGHVRYCTAGKVDIECAQPLGTNDRVSLVHNGNLTNADELRLILRQHDIQVSTGSDSEVLLRVFNLAYKLNAKYCFSNERIFDAVNTVMTICEGSYSVILMMPTVGLVAFRDPRGIRPLCFGQLESGGYAVASESVAFTGTNTRDIQAGECVIISDHEIVKKQIADNAIQNPCLFEYIYFARPESTIDGILVYQARKNMGEALAVKMLREQGDLVNAIDVVMPVPDSARISALRASYVLQKPYCEGLIKNNYVGRTFIMPSQTERKKSLKMKLNTIEQEFRDKTVLIIDDSIVRGNTSIQIIELIRKAGVKRIIFASIAPPVVDTNVYGIAIPTKEELIAAAPNSDVVQILGADELIYNTLDDVVAACRQINPAITGFETSCFG